MKFVIRDDDLNYFSAPEDVERWYANFFNDNVPVGFSAIPFVKPESDVYTAGKPSDDREYPIGDNRELVGYVKTHPQMEILQHGTTHETKDGAYEYAQAVPRNETQRGKEELTRAFGTEIRVFVPPHDWIGRSGVLAVEAARLDIIRGRGAGLRNLIVRPAYVRVFLTMAFFKLGHAILGRVPAYPFVLDFGKHKEVCSYRLEDSDVFTGLEYAHRKDGVFVVVTHLHTFTEEKKARLEQLVARARALNAAFVQPYALFA